MSQNSPREEGLGEAITRENFPIYCGRCHGIKFVIAKEDDRLLLVCTSCGNAMPVGKFNG